MQTTIDTVTYGMLMQAWAASATLPAVDEPAPVRISSTKLQILMADIFQRPVNVSLIETVGRFALVEYTPLPDPDPDIVVWIGRVSDASRRFHHALLAFQETRRPSDSGDMEAWYRRGKAAVRQTLSPLSELGPHPAEANFFLTWAMYKVASYDTVHGRSRQRSQRHRYVRSEPRRERKLTRRERDRELAILGSMYL